MLARISLALSLALPACAYGPEVYSAPPTGATLPGYAFPCRAGQSALTQPLTAHPAWCVEVSKSCPE